MKKWKLREFIIDTLKQYGKQIVVEEIPFKGNLIITHKMHFDLNISNLDDIAGEIINYLLKEQS